MISPQIGVWETVHRVDWFRVESGGTMPYGAGDGTVLGSEGLAWGTGSCQDSNLGHLHGWAEAPQEHRTRRDRQNQPRARSCGAGTTELQYSGRTGTVELGPWIH